MDSRKLLDATLCLALFGWCCIAIADFSARYKLDVNAGSAPPYLFYIFENHKELFRSLFSFIQDPLGLIFVLLFFIPASIAGLMKGNVAFKFFVVGGMVLLTLLDLYQLISFEGGDRKGCEGCFFMLVLHVIFGSITLVLAVVIFIWHISTRRLT